MRTALPQTAIAVSKWPTSPGRGVEGRKGIIGGSGKKKKEGREKGGRERK